MNESALEKGFPNRLDIKFHSFYPKYSNTSCQLYHLNQHQGDLNEINNTWKGGRLKIEIQKWRINKSGLWKKVKNRTPYRNIYLFIKFQFHLVYNLLSIIPWWALSSEYNKLRIIQIITYLWLHLTEIYVIYISPAGVHDPLACSTLGGGFPNP